MLYTMWVEHINIYSPTQKICNLPPNTRHGEHFSAVSVPPGVYRQWHQTAGWLQPSVASCQTPWAVSGWPPNVECFENWMWSHYAWIFWRFRHINHSFTDSSYKQSAELGSGKLSCISKATHSWSNLDKSFTSQLVNCWLKKN